MAQNIKVAVRARPLNQREIDMDCEVVVSMKDKTATIQVNKTPKHFTYDFLYNSIHADDPSSSTQAEIYQEIGSTILANAIDGFNGTLFAYGQTGSGKSHTMMGPSEDYGIIPLMITDLFAKKEAIEEDPERELQIWVSYLEIYKERITDLFGAVDKQQEVKIAEHPKLGVYTQGLVELPCETQQAVMTNLEYGLQRRSIGATNMNQTSSRSHAVFCLKTTALQGPKPVKKGQEDERKALSAKINLIDLAGSERASKTGAEGERLKEGSAINQSLSSLGMVIKALTEKQQAKVPFRASKLTFYLKDSLAGNSRTYMMAAVSPASDNADETLSTLRFASSVKSIETVAVQNKDKKDQLIDDLQEEMKQLKAQLAAGACASAADAMEQLRERERLLQEEVQKDFREQLEVAKELQRAREQALQENGLSQHHITRAFGLGSATPYLVNMAFDPMLAGCLIYLIKEAEPTRVGAHKDNSIILDGIGIPDFLCRIDNLPEAGVRIRRLCDAGRVGVNGRLLKEGEELQLHNGDQVYLGRSTALKLVCPEQDGAAPALSKADLLLEGDAELAMLEHSPSWASLEMFVDPVIRQLPPAAASSFLQDIKRACQLSDEANELTPEYRRDLPHQFEVDLTSSVPPCVVIRVLTCPQGRECTDEEAWSTKYVWSLSQLEERVDRMRDYCRSVALDEKVALDSLEDPWIEAEPVEIVQRLRDLRQVAEEADRAMLQQLSMSRNRASNDRHILSIVFWFWKSLVAAEKKKRTPSRVGRPALVRSGTFNQKMRMTVVPNRGTPLSPPARKRGATDAAGTPSPASPRKSGPRGSADSAAGGSPARPSLGAEVAGGPSARAAAPAAPASPAHCVTFAVDEAPEAPPEVTTAEPQAAAAGGAGKGGGPAADGEALASLRSAAREAERSAAGMRQENERLMRQLSEREAECGELRARAERDARALEARLGEADDLRRQLRESRAQGDDLRKQLDVAWQLSMVLRDQLLCMRPQADEGVAGQEVRPSDVVATADALAATARSVTAAAQAMHEIRAALVGQASCSAPPTPSPGNAALLSPEGPRQGLPAPWAGLLPCERGRSVSPLGRPAASPVPVRCVMSPPSAGLLVAPSPSTPPVSWPSPSFVAAAAIGGSATLAAGARKVVPPGCAGYARSSPSRVRLAYMPSASPLRLRPPGSGASTPLCTPPVPAPAVAAVLAAQLPDRARSPSPRPARAPPERSAPPRPLREPAAGAAVAALAGAPPMARSPPAQLPGRPQDWPPVGVPGG